MNSSQSLVAYVGCRTTKERNAQGRGLTVFKVHPEKAWEQIQLIEGVPNPSYLCVHPTQPRLYAVHGDFSEVSTYETRPDGTLLPLALDSTAGRNPVHLALSPSLKWLLIANYATGNVIVLRVDVAGNLGSMASEFRFEGNAGPDRQQDGSHPHQICFSPDGRFVLVPDKGLDCVFTLGLDDATGQLSHVATCVFPPGTGPRHMVMELGSERAFIVGELDRTIHAGVFNRLSGKLTVRSVQSTVPEGVSEGSAAGIVMDGLRQMLYVSNRGHDSIASFALGAGPEYLPPCAQWICTRRTPRFIVQIGSSLIVAHEDGNSIGKVPLGGSGEAIVAVTGSPVCVAICSPQP